MLLGRLIEAIKPRQKLNLNDQSVVVNGCDSGIGLGVLRLMIVFTFTEEDAVNKAMAQIKTISDRKIRGVVHNAGAVLPGFIECQLMDTCRRIMDVNFLRWRG